MAKRGMIGLMGTIYGDVDKTEPLPERPFPAPRDMEVFDGYGADKSDLRRGYLEPEIKQLPKYDRENYVDRSSEPKVSDIDEGGPGMRDDWQFRMKDRQSRGFLTRPRIPTER